MRPIVNAVVAEIGRRQLQLALFAHRCVFWVGLTYVACFVLARGPATLVVRPDLGSRARTRERRQRCPKSRTP